MRELLTLFVSLLLLAACSDDTPVDTTWRSALDSSSSSEAGWRMNIWGLSADALYAAGGALDEGTLLRLDATVGEDGEWSPVALPETVPLLNWSFGFGADDIHVVGNEGTILHYDGSAWTVTESGTDQDLWGVWGAAPNDVWAVGGTARGSSGVPTLLHYDGSVWTSETVPPLTPSNVSALFKVWGSSASDVYVVGDVGVVIHYDGAAWEEQLVGASDDLVAVWGTGPDDVVAVGGRSNGIVARWNGVEWRSEFLTPLPGLNGVWMREPGVAHVVGLRGTLAVLDAETLEYTEAIPDEVLDFHAVYGVDDELFAVGGNLAVPSSPEGIAWRRQLAAGE